MACRKYSLQHWLTHATHTLKTHLSRFRFGLCDAAGHDVLDGPVRAPLPVPGGAHDRRRRPAVLRAQEAREKLVALPAQVRDGGGRVPEGQQEAAHRRPGHRLGGDGLPQPRRTPVRLHANPSHLHEDEPQGAAGDYRTP